MKRSSSGKAVSPKKPGAAKKPKVSKTARIFMDLIAVLDYQQGPKPARRGLSNLTFWAGAGFSKSWDPTSPIGSELFTLDSSVIERVANSAAVARMFGVDPYDGISANQLRQIVYQIDMHERYPDVRSRYLDDQNLSMLRASLRATVVNRFNDITPLNYFDDALQKFPIQNPTIAQQDIGALFSYLHKRITGSEPMVEGVRTHFVTTNYDFVIETILDNIIGLDDSLFLYTYRGFTPYKVADQPNLAPVHQHWLAGHLLKINGGFEILRDQNGYVLDYSRRGSQAILDNPPVLMLPSREQDYSDPYFRTIFPKAVRLMRETNILVLVGYSLPEDDALIRFILRQFAEEAEDGREKCIFYIGPDSDAEKRAALANVFPSIADVRVPHVFTYQGKFDEFAAECLTFVKDPTL